MKLINLCEYTLNQSLCDTGNYYNPFITAQEIINQLNLKEVK